MFGFLKKKKLGDDPTLVSPISGEVAEISRSSDQMFAEKKMGDGLVIFPETGELVSPVAAKVIMIAATKHAIGLKMANGIEVLLHLGVDTVELKGEPFDLKIKVGDILRPGDQIGSIDLNKIKKSEFSDEVLLIFTSDQIKVSKFKLAYGKHQVGEKIGEVRMH